MTKRVLYFRETRSNRFTIPVLVNGLCRAGLDLHFEIRLAKSPDFHPASNHDTPPMCIYSFMTPHVHEVADEIHRIRSVRNPPLLVAGGPHACGDPEGTLAMGFDAVAVGAGEILLPALCREILGGSEIQGRIFRSAEKADLDESFPFSEYTSFVPPLEITRGCMYACRFCQTGRGRPVHRSFESIQRYLDELKRRGFLFRVEFICPSGFEYGSVSAGNPDPGAIENLLRIAKATGFRHLEYGIFPSEVRPNTVTASLLQLVKLHCSNRKITIGAQSGSRRMLEELKRGHSVEDIEHAVACIRQQGFKPMLDFILGYPGETEEDQMKTLELARLMANRHQARSQMHFFMPLAGTPLAGLEPVFPTKSIIQMLDSQYRDGVCTNWWRDGMALSRRIVDLDKRKNTRNAPRS